MLLVKGGLYQRPADGALFLSLGSFHWAWMGVRLRTDHDGRASFRGAAVEMLFAYDASDWRGVPFEVAVAEGVGISLRQTEPAEDLLPYAVRLGAVYTVAQLRKLASSLGIRVDKLTGQRSLTQQAYIVVCFYRVFVHLVAAQCHAAILRNFA